MLPAGMPHEPPSRRVALVTGASSGIGRAIALRLAGAGLCVGLLARREEPLRTVAGQIAQAGGESLVLPADAADAQAVDAACARCVTAWGRLDVVVVAAGVGYAGRIADQAPAEWEEMLLTNVLGVSISVQGALRNFDSVQGGDIVVIGSTSGHRVPSDGGFYAATKAAVRALAEVTRNELAACGSASRISSVSPGRVATSLFGIETLPAPDVLSPDDVAEAVLNVLATPRHAAVGDLILRARETRR